MRATVTPSPIRKGKRRLLSSCAIAAGIVALAYGGPALAQVAGSGTITPLPSGPTSNTGVNPSTVNVSGAQTIIDWTPSNSPVSGVVDFLPTTNSLTFVGNTPDYIVLNRFVGTGSNQVGINGEVNSFLNVPGVGNRQEGNIWFYNAGGILIGPDAVFNVGSLVLTSNAIDTTDGLLGPGNTIRFRGVSGNVAPVTVLGTINADNVAHPGTSYVALVAPRVVQAGNVGVYGSAAYVGAEQADIRINGGLFDINVLVGAEGGNVITHTGTTTGPEQQAGSTAPAQRIYMVAIPKNVAVGMLVSGQVGYQDGAITATTDSDGSVVLSAGYNVTEGVINAAPVSAVGADITVNDVIFRSSVTAHASGAFLGQPLATLPTPGGPVSVVPPPHLGRFLVEGDGTFIGDTSSTLNISGNRIAGATGTLTIQSDGSGTSVGNAAVNVDNGGGILTVGGLSVVAGGPVDAATGNRRGGNAAVSITSGGRVQTSALQVSAASTGAIGASGAGGTGTGGTAGLTISDAGSQLVAGTVSLDASGFGGGLSTNASGVTSAADASGNGQGGTALLTIGNAGSLITSAGIDVSAYGFGEIGNVQSGSGTGGTARVSINGTPGLTSTAFLTINAAGFGGGISQRSPSEIYSTRGGNGRGGTADLLITGGAYSGLNLGDVGLNAAASGGGAGNSENTIGGNASGGTINVTIDGGATPFISNLSLNSRADSGGSTSPTGLTALSGNAQGGSTNVTTRGGSALQVGGNATIDVAGLSAASENIGSGTGGNVTVSALSGGAITFSNGVNVNAFGGSLSSGLPQTVGSGTGGTVTILADTSGSIGAAYYDLDARANVVNASGNNGIARGGRITMTALNGGLVESLSDGLDFMGVNAQTGYSQGGSSATGGDITLFANEGTIRLANLILSASGLSGGALVPGEEQPVGLGGNILIRTGFSSASQMNIVTFSGSADGRTLAFVEGSGGGNFEPSGDGQGGTIAIEANGADFTISGGANLTADGYGGLGGTSATGRGGTATFTQIAGDVNVGNIQLSANGVGGQMEGRSGEGIGGDASMIFSGGVFTGGDVSVAANGTGGSAFDGDDFDSSNILAAGAGGDGRGGNALIRVENDAVVNTAVLAAHASGTGAGGGDFYSYNGIAGSGADGGSGRGGNADINLLSGEVNSDAIITDAGGFGGSGGSLVDSSSSGSPIGASVGGKGGDGNGGFATINIGSTLLDISESLSSRASGTGGNGGDGSIGGSGGAGTGGLAQAIVDNYDAGDLALLLDTSARGGNGGNGSDGNGGNGGDAIGGRSRIEATGEGASITVSQANFENSATGGNGGSAGTASSSRPRTGATGGNGGFGMGGEIEIVATDRGTVGLGIGRSGGNLFTSTGTGGDGGRGADNPGTITLPGDDLVLGTPDDIIQGLQGGNGGIGGEGSGGTVRLSAAGGTITSGGAAVEISVTGMSGDGGAGGTGSGGVGNCCSSFIDFGGRVIFEALTTSAGAGRISLGDTTIEASGGAAGRIEMHAGGNITMSSLVADTFGFSFPTNNNTSEIGQGIFLETNGGTISTTGEMTLRASGSIGVYGQDGGLVSAGGNLTMAADDQVDLRGQTGNPTLSAGGDFLITAGNSISGADGSSLDADGRLQLNTTNANAYIDVDRIKGGEIVINTAGHADVEHAEADDSLRAEVGSFRTGRNSIITGGDIQITAAGAVNLGNSTAGGFVSVIGQSIDFTNIDGGFFIGLTATGTSPGFEGIRGGTITGDGNVLLSGNSVDVDSITADGYLSAFASGGNVAIDQASLAQSIDIRAQGNITGVYAGGEDVFLQADGDIVASARAIGDGSSSSSGSPVAASVYAEAGGNISLTDNQASGMFGVSAGGSASIDGATVGEDMLVLAQGTATLANVTVGDDIDVRAAGNIRATNVRATGLGPDGFQLNYSPSSGFTINQGEGSSTLDGADIDIRSSGGSINAAELYAGDDIFLSAATIALNGATTFGVGITGGDSSIRTTGGDTSISGLNAFSDVLIDSTGTTDVTGTVIAGRNVSINADAVTLANLVTPGGQTIDTISAGGNIGVTSTTDITGGALTAGGSLTLTADGAIAIDAAASGEDAEMTLTGVDGIDANILRSRGVMTLTSDAGAVRVGSLSVRDAVSVDADSLDIGTNGPVEFANIVTDVGDAAIRANNRLIINAANIAGTARFSDTGEHIIIRDLTAGAADFDANEMLSMTNVSVVGDLDANAGTTIAIDGTVTGLDISLASADISIASSGRVGTAERTRSLEVVNNDDEQQTFVGGTGSKNGYHIDADELTRLFAADIQIFAPEVNTVGGGSVGSAAPPDVIVDTFTMTGGSPGSNIGPGGSLTITTPGKMRVLGNVRLTGLSDSNALNLVANDALEVILGQGTVRLLGANDAPGGILRMVSDDVIVATPAAITDVRNANSIDAISARLAQNDGIVLDEGALLARRIAFEVGGGAYVQNSGSGTDFSQRRGLTFGAGGLDVLPRGTPRIVLNGVHLGANGLVTGLDTIQLLTIAGSPVPSGGTASGLGFDPRSTLNGCFIANTGSCTTVTVEIDRMFPVQDVIEDEDSDGSDGDGISLPTALITMRDLDPLSGEPLLDDPVTGAGNDDLWTPTTDTQQP